MTGFHYIAKLYVGQAVVASESGNDETALYEWMLAQAQGVLGDVHGEVIDNETGKVVQRFCKSPPD